MIRQTRSEWKNEQVHQRAPERSTQMPGRLPQIAPQDLAVPLAVTRNKFVGAAAAAISQRA